MRIAIILGTLLIAGLEYVALAEEEDKILFSDDFSTPDPAWGRQTSNFGSKTTK